MNCELCGRQIDHYHEVIIDGVKMKVCNDCAKYGKEVTKKVATFHRTPIPPPVHNVAPMHFQPSPPLRRRVSDLSDDFKEPVIDFGKVIKKRREEMGISQEELANKLQEKKNLVAKIEREEIKPDRQTARKIEKLMGIRILEEVK